MSGDQSVSDTEQVAATAEVTPWPGRLQILSLDGGGVKGMFSAALLDCIERDLGITIADHFDLVTGTSTGGIIAVGLGAALQPKAILDLYHELGPKVFKNPGGLRSKARHFFHSKYEPSGLRTALEQTLGNKTLADSAVRLVIPAFNLDMNDVYLFKTPHNSRLTRDPTVKLSDVALATSAAPTYFPAFQLGNIRLVDGGVWANNPAMVGVTEAVSLLGARLEDIRVLSLGTTSDLRNRQRDLDDGGLFAWKKAIVTTILDGQSVGTNAQVIHLLGKENVLRIDTTVPEGLFELDRASSRELLSRAESVSRHWTPDIKKRFLEHRAAPFAALQNSPRGTV